MQSYRRLRNFLKALLGFIVLFSACTSASAAGWYEYQSENFTVYSDVSEPDVQKLMRDLERFRRAALAFTGQEEVPENRNLRVFHFRDSSEFAQFSGDGKIAGFYRETWRGPIIFSRDSDHGISGSGLIFHEYVHHLMRERSGMIYPRWYSEGFAELLASAEMQTKSVMIGGVPEWRLSAWTSEEPLTIEQLLTPEFAKVHAGDSGRYWNNYYASAWLLTHYLQLGHNAGHADYRRATGLYLQAVAAGEDPVKSFSEYFGKSVAEFQQEVQRYMQSDISRYRLEIPAYTYSIPRRELMENERLLLLASEAADLEKPALAMDYLEKSEREGLGWQENLTAMALVSARQGDFGPGKKIAEEIGEYGQISYLTAANLAQFYLLRLQSLSVTQEWSQEDYLAAVKYGGMAVQMGPHYLPGYRALWTAYQRGGKSEAALQVMMRAYHQEPNHLNLNAAIGFYLAHLGKSELAREYLERVVAWSHSDELRTNAERLLAGKK